MAEVQNTFINSLMQGIGNSIKIQSAGDFIGRNLLPVVATYVATMRLAVKPAVMTLPGAQRQEFVKHLPMGNLSIGRV